MSIEQSSTRRRGRRIGTRAFLTLVLALVSALLATTADPAPAEVRSLDRERARMILQNVYQEVEEHFYDPQFNGVDLAARFEKAEADLGEATSLGQLFGFIALAVMELDDSHTWFLPPPRTVRVEYGWRMRAYGDSCSVTSVKPGSDAEAKGLKPGDRVVAVGGRALTRENLGLFNYRYHILQPEGSLRLTVEGSDGEQREVEVMAEVERQKRLLDLSARDNMDFWNRVREAQNDSGEHKYATLSGEGCDKPVFYWRLPHFDGDLGILRRMVSKARDHDALILDLRGNAGGAVEYLEELVGSLFDEEVAIGRFKDREGVTPQVAKSRGRRAFAGDLVVLVDSSSGSSSEVLARVVQLEKRGAVVGDRTAGSVMVSRVFSQKLGWNRTIPYAVQISTADFFLPDGQRLEGVGVTPDELLTPTAEELAGGLDPVLTRASQRLGCRLDPAHAGELTRYEWD